MQSMTLTHRFREGGVDRPTNNAIQIENCLDLVVVGLRVAVVINPLSGRNRTMHFLGLQGGGVVQVDMVEGPNAHRGDLQVTPRAQDFYQLHATGFEYDTKIGFKLRDFLELLTEHKWHEYQFTPDGQGSRYWNVCVVSAYEENKLVDEGVSQELWERLLYRWHTFGSPTRASILAGSFDNPATRSKGGIALGMIGRAISWDITRNGFMYSLERLRQLDDAVKELRTTRENRDQLHRDRPATAPQRATTERAPVSQPSDTADGALTLTLRPRNP